MEELILVALIGLTAGMVKGLSGFGSSLVTIPLLSKVYGVDRFVEITVMLITINVVLNILLMFENKAFSLKSLEEVLPITIFGAVFTLVGLIVLKNLNGEIINYIAAGLILMAIIVTAYNLFVDKKIKIKPNLALKVLVGTLSGLGNGIASVDGPPVVFYLTGTNAQKATFKNTLATHFLVMGIIGVILIIINNMYTVDILINTGYLAIFTIIGVLGGMVISKQLNERNFQMVVLVILLVLDIKMIFF